MYIDMPLLLFFFLSCRFCSITLSWPYHGTSILPLLLGFKCSISLNASWSLCISLFSTFVMASKLFNQLRTIYRISYHIVNLRIPNPNPNIPVSRSILIAPQTFLQARPYSDVIQGKDGLKSGENVNRASISSLNEAELFKFSAIADTWWVCFHPCFMSNIVVHPGTLTNRDFRYSNLQSKCWTRKQFT